MYIEETTFKYRLGSSTSVVPVIILFILQKTLSQEFLVNQKLFVDRQRYPGPLLVSVSSSDKERALAKSKGFGNFVFIFGRPAATGQYKNCMELDQCHQVENAFPRHCQVIVLTVLHPFQCLEC